MSMWEFHAHLAGWNAAHTQPDEAPPPMTPEDFDEMMSRP